MADTPLSGKKIAVLVESQYIAQEIACYQTRFAELGADVHLMTRLWGQPKQTFVSEVEEAGTTPETLDVTIDVDQVSVTDYAAVIMAANYTSVRLRWSDDSLTSADPRAAAAAPPAVRFFGAAMQDRQIVKAAPCHGLWLLTPTPEILAGRRVTCNPVVLADVLNAGVVYVPAPDAAEWYRHVVVDDDLVTNMSAVHDGQPVGTELLVDAITEQILARAPAA